MYDRQVLYAAPAREDGTPERGTAPDQLDALLTDRQAAEEPDHLGPLGRYPDMLLRLPGQPVPPGSALARRLAQPVSGSPGRGSCCCGEEPPGAA
ncbi:hypothetical protein [Streptomyces hirsutus]|uniref:hypothetical protein n=1 Tax=Streptomyces hirsutus TaxID=35620 RepID=UPI003316C746